MNRFPIWKNTLIILVLLFGLVYTIPNFYGEVPAVQISSGKATVNLESALVQPLDRALREEGLNPTAVLIDENSIRFRFDDTEEQIRARDLIEGRLNPDPADPSYIVALNLLPATPNWLTSIRALPMYLGLDLRGGVHFLLEVDMPGAVVNRLDSTAGDLRTLMRDRRIRHAGINREGNTIHLRFRDAEQRAAARTAILNNTNDLQLVERDDADDDLRLIATLTPLAQQTIREFAITQNITTLRNRINELGVAEPIIQQQGADRIVVQLPGVQDVAKAKDILGRTATLEIRMVDDSPGSLEAALQGQVPFGTELYTERGGSPLLVRNEVVLTGDRLVDAQPGFDGQTNEPAVHLTLDSAGARIFRDVTRENVGKRMAILLIERGRGEVVTAPVIRTEIGGGRVQISGRMTTTEANQVALLLRAGSLAAPMEIIEERTVGPSLGAENIARGFNSVMWGMVAIAIFIAVYYSAVGIMSVAALTANLMLLIALLSLLQATLTLPGIAAIALTLGMAIDANVLINERIREELRNGSSPQAAINAGYDRAFDTILDANVTTFIAGIALLVFGSGPVRGFAVVLCLGIITSVFSAVLVSRMFVNFLYGRQRKLAGIRIG
ncbi:MAG TPA: protein translocase subunit SecD [Azoarcus taiwanensis]|nr:protein translocase subunit SecD [Azoarcus taiwanensis]